MPTNVIPFAGVPAMGQRKSVSIIPGRASAVAGMAQTLLEK
jgi:hypothetical protein